MSTIIHVSRIDFEHKNYKRQFKCDFYTTIEGLVSIRKEYSRRFDTLNEQKEYTKKLYFYYNEAKKIRLKWKQ